MKKTIIALLCMVLASASALGYTSNEIDWKSNAADGNLASAANWSKVPGGVTDISYNLASDVGYWGMFAIGSKTLNLYISEPFTFDRLYFQGSNSKYNIDLGGNTLTLRGAATYELTTNPSYKPQKVFVTNGDIAFSKSTRREFRAQGEGNVITIAGTEERPVTVSGGVFKPTATSGGELVFSNTVFASGVNVMLNGGPGCRISFLGPNTTLAHNANGYFGLGSSTSSNTLVIAQGAKVLADNAVTGHKNSITVGESGGCNTLIVAGEGTVLSNSNRTAKSNDASIAVGKRSNGNFLHVTDGAELNLTAHIVIGNPLTDLNPGSSANNRIRIDTNAVVYASGLRIGQRSEDGSGAAFFTSNICEVAKNAKVYIEDKAEGRDESIRLATQANINYSALSISEDSQVFAKYAQIGLFGISNRMDVVSGGMLVSKSSATSDAGLLVGGVGSSGTVVNVDGGIVALTNTLFAMRGASAGSRTLVRIANGADVCAQFVSVTNAGNRIEIDNATFTVRTSGRFPRAGESSVELAFAGAHPLLSYEDVSHGSVAKAFSFAEGASLEFVVPTGGYAESPIKSVNGIMVSGISAVAIDAAAFLAAGGREQVLMDAGAGAISIDAASMNVLKTAAGEDWSVKLVDNGKRMVLLRKSGFVLIVR